MTTQEIEKARSRKVRKANRLVQDSRYRLSAVAQRLVLYLISRVEPEDTFFKPCQISIADFYSVCGVPAGGRDYKEIKRTVSELRSATIGWVDNGDGSTDLVGWVTGCRIDMKKQIVLIQLDPALIPYLINLKSHYVSFPLAYPLRLQSMYAVRLYEIIASYQYNNNMPFVKRIKLDRLRELLDLDEDQYTRYCNLKQKVISVATEEINAYTDKYIEIKEVKTGRKVTALEFSISTKRGTELDNISQAAGLPAQQTLAAQPDKPTQPKPRRAAGRVPATQRTEYRCEESNAELTPSRRQKLASMKRLKDAI